MKRPAITDARQLANTALLQMKTATGDGVWEKVSADKQYIMGLIGGIMYVTSGATQAQQVLEEFIDEVREATAIVKPEAD